MNAVQAAVAAREGFLQVRRLLKEANSPQGCENALRKLTTTVGNESALFACQLEAITDPAKAKIAKILTGMRDPFFKKSAGRVSAASFRGPDSARRYLERTAKSLLYGVKRCYAQVHDLPAPRDLPHPGVRLRPPRLLEY